MQDARPIPPFRCDQIETGKLAREWTTWKEALECYFAAYDISDQYAMRAKLLHLGGPALQRVFKNLKDTDRVPLVAIKPAWYDAAVEKLDEFFEPRHQSTSERRKLRLMKQMPRERFADFIIRLKQQVSQCGFEKHGVEVSEILSNIFLTDAVVEGCISNEVRKMILLKDLSFSEIEAIGIAQESVHQQIEEMSTLQTQEKIFQIEHNRGTRGRLTQGLKRKIERSCFNCGRPGHIAVSALCTARGKQCRNCKCYGHFEKFCRKTKRPMEKNNEKEIQAVEEFQRVEHELTPKISEEGKEKNDETKIYYAFYSGNESNIITCVIGGINVEMLIDSGADGNLITGEMWSKLKNNRVNVISCTKGSSRILRAYGSQKPLVIIGSFVADISVGELTVRADFFVVVGRTALPARR